MATQILRPIFIQPSRLNEYLDESINLVNFYGEPISITFRDIDKWLTFSFVSLMSYGVAIGLIFPVLLLILYFYNQRRFKILSSGLSLKHFHSRLSIESRCFQHYRLRRALCRFRSGVSRRPHSGAIPKNLRSAPYSRRNLPGRLLRFTLCNAYFANPSRLLGKQEDSTCHYSCSFRSRTCVARS